MKYAVYVKFRRTDNGGDQWSGNQDRTDESREVAERATVENLKKHFPIERVLKVISFEYGDDEIAPSFCDMTERADKEARKEFAIVEVADELRKINSSMDVYSMRIANKIARRGSSNAFMKIAAIAALTMLGVQIALLLWQILR